MCIINFIYLFYILYKYYNITLYHNHLLFNIRIFTMVLYICKHYLYNRVVQFCTKYSSQSNYPYDII